MVVRENYTIVFEIWSKWTAECTEKHLWLTKYFNVISRETFIACS